MLLQDAVSVSWREKPFSGRVHRAALPQGMSCAEIVASVPNLDLRSFLEQGTICINGEPVPRAMWPFVRPKSRKDVIVTLHAPLLGGGSSKDVLRIVAVIALVVVANAITGGAAAPLLGSAFAAGTVGATVLAATVTLGGSLLLGAFVKPPSSEIEEDTSSSQEEGLGPAALQGNQLRRGASIPRVVGTHRVFPPFLSQPLVDIVEYDEVIEGVYGLAGPHKLRDFKFGESRADDIDPEQLEYEFYELSEDDTGISEAVKLMARLVGSQDSLVFVDDSDIGSDIIASGEGVFIDRRAGYISTAAAFFNGSAHLTIAANSSFNMSTNNWSMDFFCEWDGAGTTAGFLLGQTDAGQTASGSAFVISKTSAGLLQAVVYNGTIATTLTSVASIETGIHHIAFARIGNTLYLWVDGVVQATADFTGGEVPLPVSVMNIGARGNDTATTRWFGWIANVRFSISPDTSWYEANTNFTPPEIPYKREFPTLIERYGKTFNPQIIMSKHRITNDPPAQGSRDLLANQVVPARSVPRTQSVAARGRQFDEVWVTLTLPGGLFYADTNFDPDWFNALPFRIRVRELGNLSEDAWVNLPEVHLHERRSSQFSRLLVFRWDSAASMPSGLVTTAPAASKGWHAAYSTVPAQEFDPIGSGGWTANSHFYSGSGDTFLHGDYQVDGQSETPNNVGSTGLQFVRLTTERAEFFLDGLIPKGPIEIEIKRGQIYTADKFFYNNYDLEANPPDDDLTDGVYDFFGWVVNNDDEAVTLLKAANASDEVIISRVAAVWNDSPIVTHTDFASVYVKVTGRNLSALSAVASGLVPDWNGSEWTGLNATSNPAPHYRDVLVGNLNDNRVPASLIDDTTLIEWRQRCANLEFECNAVFDGEQVDRVLEVIASCGYARPRMSELFDVAQDRDFSSITPVQMFSPRNMRGFRWEKAFVRHRPDGLRVRFNNIADDYIERTIVVPRPGLLGSAEGARLEEIRYDGITSEYEAVLKALYDQQQVVDRFTFYHGEVDAEMLVCRRGDLVLVQHDILDTHAGFSRVLSFVESDGFVQSIRLDGTVDPINAFFTTPTEFFDTPTPFFTDDVGVGIRLKNGMMISFEASLSADGFVLTPRTPVSSESLERECLVTTGRLLRANQRMLVYNIRPRADLMAELTFIDEAPQLWQFPEPLAVGDEFMRNRVINGDMSLFQRGAAIDAPANDTTYTADRWYARLSNNGGNVDITQETDNPPPGFDYYLRATVGTQVDPINGSHALGMVIEKAALVGFDWGRDSARQAALSFSVRASIAGTYYGALVYKPSGGTPAEVSYVFSFSVPIADQWFRRVITIPVPTGIDASDLEATFELEFSLGGDDNSTVNTNQWQSGDFRRGTLDDGIMSTVSATMDISGVQLEPAPATQFEWLPIAMRQELARRYYQRYNFNAEAVIVGTGVCISTTQARIAIPLAVPLRGPPDIAYNTISDLQLQASGAAISATAIELDGTSILEAQTLSVLVTVAAGLTAGQAVVLQLAANYLSFDSELEPL